MSRVARKPVFGVSDQVLTNWAVQPQKMAGYFGFRKERDCTIYVAKTNLKALISCVVTAKKQVFL